MDTAILIHIQVLTSISDTDDGNIAQFRPWFDGRNFKIVLIIWANNYIIEE